MTTFIGRKLGQFGLRGGTNLEADCVLCFMFSLPSVYLFVSERFKEAGWLELVDTQSLAQRSVDYISVMIVIWDLCH